MRPMSQMRPPRTWLREPLLHLLLAGGGLLLVHRAVAPRRERITVGAEERAALRADQQRRGGAPSAEDERQRVERFIDSELLYREALARGLDRGDVIVRRRLIQKMEFLLEAEADAEPPEAELAAALAASPGRYALPERLSLEQVFLSTERPAGARC